MAKKKQLDVRIDHTVKEALKKLAKADGRPLSNYVNKILTDFVTDGLNRLAADVKGEDNG
jgi:hypothetical protein